MTVPDNSRKINASATTSHINAAISHRVVER
jgi:hypothetical protein